MIGQQISFLILERFSKPRNNMKIKEAIMKTMPKLVKKSALLAVGLTLLLPALSPLLIAAQITDCDAQITPNQVDSGSTNSFTVVVTNGSAQRIRWLKFTRPSANFTLSGITATGWAVVSADSAAIVVNGNTINTGVSRTFTLTDVSAANVNAPSANWTVEAADNGSGSSPYTCTGSFGTQIGTPDVTAPIISNIAVSAITSSAATISWTTDELATSVVNYGSTASYGSNINNSSLTTNHVLNLPNLSANTGYHFQVVSLDASDNTASSADNTFLTESVSTPSTPASSSASIPTSKLANNPTDPTAPSVVLLTNFSNAYLESPLITGMASDNSAVTLLEYSTDGGANWLPIEKVVGAGSKQASFEFRPLGLPDGNYDIFVRALDPVGNEGISAKSVLIIDRLPPLIGPNLVSFGSQLAEAKSDVIFAVIGVDERITLSTVGGPSSVVIRAETSEGKQVKFFSLTKIQNTNLWSGILAFEEPGVYKLHASAIDGANNKTARELNTVYVHKPSHVTNSEANGINKAKVTINYFETETSTWSVWDSASFGQENPQTTNSQGEFDFFLPAGRYYMEVSATGYYSKRSDIFTKKEAGPIASQVALEKVFSLGVGNIRLLLPKVSIMGFKVNPETEIAQDILSDKLKGQTLADFELLSSDKKTVKTVQLAGKPSLLTFVSTWSSATEDQITLLENLAENNNYNVFVLTSLESIEKVKAYRQIGDYKVTFIFDPDGQLLDKFNLLSLPKHIVVGRNLVVKQAINGVLTKEELQKLLNKS